MASPRDNSPLAHGQSGQSQILTLPAFLTTGIAISDHILAIRHKRRSVEVGGMFWQRFSFLFGSDGQEHFYILPFFPSCPWFSEKHGCGLQLACSHEATSQDVS